MNDARINNLKLDTIEIVCDFFQKHWKTFQGLKTHLIQKCELQLADHNLQNFIVLKFHICLLQYN